MFRGECAGVTLNLEQPRAWEFQEKPSWVANITVHGIEETADVSEFFKPPKFTLKQILKSAVRWWWKFLDNPDDPFDNRLQPL